MKRNIATMKRNILILLLAITTMAGWGYDPKLLIYRNDHDFNVVNLTQGTSVVHNMNMEDSTITVDGKEIPIQAIDSCVVRQSDIPTLWFTLPEHPEAEQVWSKDEYVKATLRVEGNGMVDDTDVMKLSVKGRGNSTWALPKRPMRLKFDKKTSLCGFTKAKSYVLLANFLDPSLMHNVISLWLANRLGIPYSNHFVPCNVMFNGRYLGSFLLTEKIGLNSGSINDIDENEGILLELSVEYDEKYKFKTTRFGLPTMVKDPDFDELYAADPTTTPDERLQLWVDDFNRATNACNFDEFDMQSFVDYELVVSFARNDEIGFPKSLYLHKANLEEGTKYVFGPIWDHDVAYDFHQPDGDGYKTYNPETGTWQHSFLLSLKARQAFRDAYTARFEEFENEILPELLEFADNYARTIEPSARLDGLRWPDIKTSGWFYRFSPFETRQIYSELRAWILDRVEAMRNNLPYVL